MSNLCSMHSVHPTTPTRALLRLRSSQPSPSKQTRDSIAHPVLVCGGVCVPLAERDQGAIGVRPLSRMSMSRLYGHLPTSAPPGARIETGSRRFGAIVWSAMVPHVMFADSQKNAVSLGSVSVPSLLRGRLTLATNHRQTRGQVAPGRDQNVEEQIRSNVRGCGTIGGTCREGFQDRRESMEWDKRVLGALDAR
jgi:hypothetical protein